MLRCLLLLLGSVVAIFASGAGAQTSAPRLALVVGNAAYSDGRLPTAVNDAGLVARALSQDGFAVTAAADLDRARLDALLESFAVQVKAAGPEAIVFVYLAGYGVQVSGDIFVMPIGAKVTRDSDIPMEGVSASDFRRKLETLPARARVLVYDLGRENPFVQEGTRLAGGLPLIEPGNGTVLAFNASPGTVAFADVTPYGFYARALSEMIVTPGLSVPALFERVRLRVSNLTAGATSPWSAGTLPESVTLASDGSTSGPLLRATDAGRPESSPSERAYLAALTRDSLDAYLDFLKTYSADSLAARARTIVAVRREALLWNETMRLDSDRAYWTYMRRYPRGPHFSDARRRLLSLRAPLDPPPRFDIVTYMSAALPQPGELSLIDRPVVNLEDSAWPPAPSTADLLPPAPAALYSDLPPAPLVADGTVPVADPLAIKELRGTGPISQPLTVSSSVETWETHFDANGGWTVSVASGAETRLRIAMTPGSNGDRTIVQTGRDGAVVARTSIVHDKGSTAIVQTGPSGGILTKAVTRADPAGGWTTITTTGGNQVVSSWQTDARGITSVTRGPAAAFPALARPPGPAFVTIPPDPPAPLPLTMPLSSLPPPAAPPATKGSEPKAPESAGPDTKSAAQKDSKAPDGQVPDTNTEQTSPEASGTPEPNVHFPATAPLPPRRATAIGKPTPAKATSASSHGGKAKSAPPHRRR